MTQSLIFRIKVIIGLVGLLWVIELINHFTGRQLLSFGLLPRDVDQWWGIYTSPFLHMNFSHIAANTPPLIWLSVLSLGLGHRRFWIASFIIISLGGLGVWFFGRYNFHVGASGWIFGLFGFLLATAFWERSIQALIFATIAIALYGGLIWGIFPTQPDGVSWEGHLFGFLAGLVAGALLHKRKTNPSSEISSQPFDKL